MAKQGHVHRVSESCSPAGLHPDLEAQLGTCPRPSSLMWVSAAFVSLSLEAGPLLTIGCQVCCDRKQGCSLKMPAAAVSSLGDTATFPYLLLGLPTPTR